MRLKKPCLYVLKLTCWLKGDKMRNPSLGITKKTPKEVLERHSSNCKNCGNCCNYDSGYVLKEDIPRIANFLKVSQQELKDSYLREVIHFNKKIYKPKLIKKGKPYGKCIFYDEQYNCMINNVKPLHCKVCGCSEISSEASIWFVLNHIVDPDDPNSIREWASYLKSHPTIPGGELHEIVPEREKLKNILEFKDLEVKENDK